MGSTALEDLGVSCAHRPRLLIVDDDEAVGRMLARVVGKDWDIVLLADGVEAVARIAAAERFDCIFCDFRMPGMSGSEFFAKVRDVDCVQAERIVFMTGGREMSDVQSFLSTVPNGCISKPFSLLEVRELLRAVLQDSEWPASGIWKCHEG